MENLHDKIHDPILRNLLS